VGAKALPTGEGSRLSCGCPPLWPTLLSCTSTSSFQRRRPDRAAVKGWSQARHPEQKERRFGLSRTQRSREHWPVILDPPAPLSGLKSPNCQDSKTKDRSPPLPPFHLSSETFPIAGMWAKVRRAQGSKQRKGVKKGKSLQQRMFLGPWPHRRWLP